MNLNTIPDMFVTDPLPERRADDLFLAWEPGTWGSSAEEFFLKKRHIDKCGRPTSWVHVSWRHGPGISNFSQTATVSGETPDDTLRMLAEQPHPSSLFEKVLAQELLDLRKKFRATTTEHDGWAALKKLRDDTQKVIDALECLTGVPRPLLKEVVACADRLLAERIES